MARPVSARGSDASVGGHFVSFLRSRSLLLNVPCLSWLSVHVVDRRPLASLGREEVAGDGRLWNVCESVNCRLKVSYRGDRLPSSDDRLHMNHMSCFSARSTLMGG